MNRFGRLLVLSIWGESHGPCIGLTLDGCPAGLSLSEEDFRGDLKRRAPGAPGTTERREGDIPFFKGGLFKGRTTGAPLVMEFDNGNIRSSDYEAQKRLPRPGHADFSAHIKYGGFADYRGGGMFSGRMTVALVAAGVVAKKMLSGIRIEAGIDSIGGFDTKMEWEEALVLAGNEGDSLGGVISCRAVGVPAGLGEPFFDSLESLFAHLAFSIPGIKGIEFGAGFSCASMKGSEFNDPILDGFGITAGNNSGGINGGISNGNDIYFRVSVRPTSSIGRRQKTIDLETGEPADVEVTGRHDTCFALRVPVIIEAAMALVLADALLLEERIPRVLPGKALE